jgi:hypothetical protein
MLIYVCTGLLYQVLFQKQIRFVLGVLATLFILVSFSFLRNYTILHQEKMVVYQINNYSAVSFIKGNQQICLVDSVLVSEPQKAEFQLANSAVSWGTKPKMIVIDSSFSDEQTGFYLDKGFGFFGNYRFAIVADQKYLPIDQDHKILVDILFIRGRKYLDLAQIQKCIGFDFIVMDGSVPKYKQNKLFMAADTLGVECYSTSKSGAYVLNF